MHRCLGWIGLGARDPGARDRDVRGAHGFVPGWKYSRCDLLPRCQRYGAQQVLQSALSVRLRLAWCCRASLRVCVHHADRDRADRRRVHDLDGHYARLRCCQRCRWTNLVCLPRRFHPDAAPGAVCLVCRRDRRVRRGLRCVHRHGHLVCQRVRGVLCVHHGLRHAHCVLHHGDRRDVHPGRRDHCCGHRCVRRVWCRCWVCLTLVQLAGCHRRTKL